MTFGHTVKVTGVLLLLALVNGQFTPGNAPDCNDPRVRAGFPYLTHERYLQLFYQCDGGLNLYKRTCPEDLVFDVSTSVCVTPQVATNERIPCDSSSVGRTYPNTCCNKYYRCTGSGYVLENCTNGQSFDMASGRCTTGSSCQNDPLCKTNGGGGGSSNYQCYDFSNLNGDPCKYRTEVGSIKIEDRPCPYGTSFNQTACSCTILDTNCPGWDYKIGKELDPQCRVSMRANFATLPLKSTSEKLPNGQTELPFRYNLIGVTLNNNQAVFRSDPILSTSYMYSYYFISNRLGLPLAISVTFRVDSGTNSLQFNLLDNNFNGVCDGEETLTVAVNYNNGNYDVTATAIGSTSTGSNEMNEIRNTGTSSASIRVNNQDYVEARLLFDGTMRLVLVNKGSSGTQNGQTQTGQTTATLGNRLAYNKCGLLIGEGLIGQVSDFSVYEGCGDLSRFNA